MTAGDGHEGVASGTHLHDWLAAANVATRIPNSGTPLLVCFAISENGNVNFTLDPGLRIKRNTSGTYVLLPTSAPGTMGGWRVADITTFPNEDAMGSRSGGPFGSNPFQLGEFFDTMNPGTYTVGSLKQEYTQIEFGIRGPTTGGGTFRLRIYDNGAALNFYDETALLRIERVTPTMNLSEPMPVVDALEKQLTLLKQLSEGGAVVATLEKRLTLLKTLASEVLGKRAGPEFQKFPDELSVLKDLVRAFEEAMPVADAFTFVVAVPGNNQAFSEAIAVVDTLVRQLSVIRPFGESVPVQDALQVRADLVRALSETLTVLDTLSSLVTLSRSFQEAVPVVDALTVEVTQITELALAEVVPLADALSVMLNLGRTFEEAFPIVDSLSVTVTPGARARISDLIFRRRRW